MSLFKLYVLILKQVSKLNAMSSIQNLLYSSIPSKYISLEPSTSTFNVSLPKLSAQSKLSVMYIHFPMCLPFYLARSTNAFLNILSL